MANKRIPDRYHSVQISRFIGEYTGRFLCWAIADHDNANRIATSERFDTIEEAQQVCDRMNLKDVR